MIKLKSKMTKLLKEKKGASTVEIIIVIAVLISVAMFFRSQVSGFAKGVIKDMFPTSQEVTEPLK